MTWLTLSHAQTEGRDVKVRFQPDAFMPDHDSPVVEVTIEGVENPDAAISILRRFHDDFVVDLVAHAQELRVLGEMDHEETVVYGTRVISRQVAYSAEELRQTAIFYSRLLREKTSHAYRQDAKLKEIHHFVTDLIERAERKISLSKRSREATDAQISALRRVLNRLDDA